MGDTKQALCKYINDAEIFEIGQEVLVWADEAHRPAKISSVIVEVGLGKVVRYYCTHSTLSKCLPAAAEYHSKHVIKKPEGL